MIHTNPTQISKARTRGLKTLSASTIASTTASFAVPVANAEIHPLVKLADDPAKIVTAILGELKGLAIAVDIESRIIEGRIDKALGSNGCPAHAQGVFALLRTRKAAEKLMRANPTCEENGFDSGFSDEDVIRLLRQIDVDIVSGASIAEACRSAGVSNATDYA